MRLCTTAAVCAKEEELQKNGVSSLAIERLLIFLLPSSLLHLLRAGSFFFFLLHTITAAATSALPVLLCRLHF